MCLVWYHSKVSLLCYSQGNESIDVHLNEWCYNSVVAVHPMMVGFARAKCFASGWVGLICGCV